MHWEPSCFALTVILPPACWSLRRQSLWLWDHRLLLPLDSFWPRLPTVLLSTSPGHRSLPSVLLSPGSSPALLPFWVEKLPECKHHPHKAPKGHFTVIYFFLDQLPPPWNTSTSVQFVGQRVVLQASESLYMFVPCIALPVPLLGISTPQSQIRGHTGPSEDPQLSIHTSLLPCLQQVFSCLSHLSLWQPLKKCTWALIHSSINSTHGHLAELGAHSVDPWLSLECSMGAIPVL